MFLFKISEDVTVDRIDDWAVSRYGSVDQFDWIRSGR
jgi:hypothetical protein